MESQKYEYLIGKTRKEVISILGQEFNYYHDPIWKYTLKKDWFIRYLMLVVIFQEGKVVSVGIKKEYSLK